MTFFARHAGALVSGISVLALCVGGASPARAQQQLDAITVVATKTEERAIDTLAPVSIVGIEQIQQLQPKRLSDVFFGMPSVTFQERGDEPATAFNVRGLQDFGRVAVLVDGARQNFQQSGHNANGYVYFEPEFLASADVVRGPVANIYGSGAIGGVVSLRTKDIDDVVRAGERWGVLTHGGLQSNGVGGLISSFSGVRVNPNIDLFGGVVYRKSANYNNGDDVTIVNTGSEVKSAIAKATFRPAEGHQVKLSGIYFDAAFDTGQPLNSYGIGTTRAFSIYSASVKNYTTNARWQYRAPDNPLIDWDLNTYWNRTDSQQLKIGHSTNSLSAYCGGTAGGSTITGCVGDTRTFLLDTIGFDANNTSRFQGNDWTHAVTLGGDAFNDRVKTFDPRGAADITTPSGERTVSGGFVQWKGNYQTWLEIVGAVRYDNYAFDGGGVNSSGRRVSPKITVGVTPFAGFTPYVSYAEGYRAPALTETLVTGAHPTGGGPGAFTCADGNPGFFCFVPNPNLRPEVGKNKEVGVNLKYDNVFQTGDAFRGKVNAFRNDLEDYIELTAYGAYNAMYGTYNFMQYQNVPDARIQGVEAELNYDAGIWFGGVSGHWIEGRNLTSNTPLATIPAARITSTLGARFWDRKLTTWVKWSAVTAQDDVPVTYNASNSYNLVNYYIGYEPTKDVLITFGVDNILDVYYIPWPTLKGSATDNTLDQQFAASAPGRVFKGSVFIRFGAL